MKDNKNEKRKKGRRSKEERREEKLGFGREKDKIIWQFRLSCAAHVMPGHFGQFH